MFLQNIPHCKILLYITTSHSLRLKDIYRLDVIFILQPSQDDFGGDINIHWGNVTQPSLRMLAPHFTPLTFI
jgi:hypothetical protein